jgi:hypothetical protein
MVLVNKQYVTGALTMQHITYSELFVCGNCHSPVHVTEAPGGDLIYQCDNPACQKAVSVDCPEALALVEDVTIQTGAPLNACAGFGCVDGCPDCAICANVTDAPETDVTMPALEPPDWPQDTNGRPLDWYAAKAAVETGTARRWRGPLLDGYWSGPLMTPREVRKRR